MCVVKIIIIPTYLYISLFIKHSGLFASNPLAPPKPEINNSLQLQSRKDEVSFSNKDCNFIENYFELACF